MNDLGKLLRSKLDNEAIERKQIVINIKGKEMNRYDSCCAENDTAMIITVDGRKAICIPFDPVLARAMTKAKVVAVDRNWDGAVKSIETVEGKVDVNIVDYKEISAKAESTIEKRKALEAIQAKLKAEQDSITKEIDALNSN